MSKILYAIIAFAAIVGTASAGLFAEPNQGMVDAINKAFATQNVTDAARIDENGELDVVLVASNDISSDSIIELVFCTNLVIGKLPELNDILYINVHIVDNAGNKIADGFVFPNSVKTKTGTELAQGVIDGTIIYV